MSEHEIKSKIDCFGTVDKKKKESCNSCNNSKLCAVFKPKLEEHKKLAEEKGRLDYIEKMTAQKSVETNKYAIYGIIVAVLLFLVWMLMQETMVLP